MGGRAKPEDEKRRIFVEIQDKWMDKAVEVYKEEQKKLPGEKRLGLRGVCKLMEERCWKEDKTQISLDKSTLTRRLNGVPSQAKSNANGGWLTEGEADAIINYANQMAREGWPLSRRRILEHANEIKQAHAEALAAWKKLEQERKARKAEMRRTYLEAVKLWDAERDAARLEKRRVRWAKPKQGKFEKAIPRPRKPEIGGSEGEDELQAEPDEEQSEEEDDD
ncbi:hypothetical protein D9615_006952 [Tricholomella constricta]|uniref:Uncharacterized protein n=1 Tax=Tricholomella constricta TaxID=117010 RepID=A0A8H5H8T7_9AGAR|nr:hypothetical protein D9615_006952 [Tricholomella constricta]